MNYKRQLSSLILLILSITPFILTPFSFALDFFFLPKIIFVYLLLTFMMIIWILNENKKFINLNEWDSTTKIICLYFIILSFSTIFSLNLHLALWGNTLREEGFFALTAYILLFLFAKRYFYLSDKYLEWLILSASIISFYGILQYFNLDFIPRDFFRADWSRMAFSTLGNPNYLGTYIVLMLPLSLYAYCKSSKFVYFVSSGLLYLGLLMTMTRGAWLGGLAGYFFIIIISCKQKMFFKKLLLLTFIMLAITLIFNLFESGYLINRFSTISEDFVSVVSKAPNYQQGGSMRIILWQHTLELIKNRPWLGYGPDTLSQAVNMLYSSDTMNILNNKMYFDKAHNEYLQIAFASGIPALVIYLVFLLDIIMIGFKQMEKNPMIPFVMASIIGYIVQAFFSNSIVSVAYIFWIFLGALLHLSTSSSN